MSGEARREADAASTGRREWWEEERGLGDIRAVCEAAGAPATAWGAAAASSSLGRRRSRDDDDEWAAVAFDASGTYRSTSRSGVDASASYRTISSTVGAPPWEGGGTVTRTTTSTTTPAAAASRGLLASPGGGGARAGTAAGASAAAAAAAAVAQVSAAAAAARHAVARATVASATAAATVSGASPSSRGVANPLVRSPERPARALLPRSRSPLRSSPAAATSSAVTEVLAAAWEAEELNARCVAAAEEGAAAGEADVVDALAARLVGGGGGTTSASGGAPTLPEAALCHAWRTWDAVFADAPLPSAKAASRAEREARRLLHNDNFAYGEIAFPSFAATLLRAAALARLASASSADGATPTPARKFVDLGSGAGRAVVAAALVGDYSEVVGIELLADLHAASAAAVTRLNALEASHGRTPHRRAVEASRALRAAVNAADLPSARREALAALPALPPITLLCGSLLGADLDSDDDLYVAGVDATVGPAAWTDGDVIFANSTCFSAAMMAAIASHADAFKPGAVVITFTRELRHPRLRTLHAERLAQSWGAATVYIQLVGPPVAAPPPPVPASPRAADAVTAPRPPPSDASATGGSGPAPPPVLSAPSSPAPPPPPPPPTGAALAAYLRRTARRPHTLSPEDARAPRDPPLLPAPHRYDVAVPALVAPARSVALPPAPAPAPSRSALLPLTAPPLPAVVPPLAPPPAPPAAAPAVRSALLPTAAVLHHPSAHPPAPSPAPATTAPLLPPSSPPSAARLLAPGGGSSVPSPSASTSAVAAAAAAARVSPSGGATPPWPAADTLLGRGGRRGSQMSYMSVRSRVSAATVEGGGSGADGAERRRRGSNRLAVGITAAAPGLGSEEEEVMTWCVSPPGSEGATARGGSVLPVEDGGSSAVVDSSATESPTMPLHAREAEVVPPRPTAAPTARAPAPLPAAPWFTPPGAPSATSSPANDALPAAPRSMPPGVPTATASPFDSELLAPLTAALRFTPTAGTLAPNASPMDDELLAAHAAHDGDASIDEAAAAAAVAAAVQHAAAAEDTNSGREGDESPMGGALLAAHAAHDDEASMDEAAAASAVWAALAHAAVGGGDGRPEGDGDGSPLGDALLAAHAHFDGAASADETAAAAAVAAAVAHGSSEGGGEGDGDESPQGADLLAARAAHDEDEAFDEAAAAAAVAAALAHASDAASLMHAHGAATAGRDNESDDDTPLGDELQAAAAMAKANVSDDSAGVIGDVPTPPVSTGHGGTPDAHVLTTPRRLSVSASPPETALPPPPPAPLYAAAVRPAAAAPPPPPSALPQPPPPPPPREVVTLQQLSPGAMAGRAHAVAIREFTPVPAVPEASPLGDALLAAKAAHAPDAALDGEAAVTVVASALEAARAHSESPTAAAFGSGDAALLIAKFVRQPDAFLDEVAAAAAVASAVLAAARSRAAARNAARTANRPAEGAAGGGHAAAAGGGAVRTTPPSPPLLERPVIALHTSPASTLPLCLPAAVVAAALAAPDHLATPQPSPQDDALLAAKFHSHGGTLPPPQVVGSAASTAGVLLVAAAAAAPHAGGGSAALPPRPPLPVSPPLAPYGDATSGTSLPMGYALLAAKAAKRRGGGGGGAPPPPPFAYDDPSSPMGGALLSAKAAAHHRAPREQSRSFDGFDLAAGGGHDGSGGGGGGVDELAVPPGGGAPAGRHTSMGSDSGGTPLQGDGDGFSDTDRAAPSPELPSGVQQRLGQALAAAAERMHGVHGTTAAARAPALRMRQDSLVDAFLDAPVDGEPTARSAGSASSSAAGGGGRMHAVSPPVVVGSAGNGGVPRRSLKTPLSIAYSRLRGAEFVPPPRSGSNGGGGSGNSGGGGGGGSGLGGGEEWRTGGGGGGGEFTPVPYDGTDSPMGDELLHRKARGARPEELTPMFADDGGSAADGTGDSALDGALDGGLNDVGLVDMVPFAAHGVELTMSAPAALAAAPLAFADNATAGEGDDVEPAPVPRVDAFVDDADAGDGGGDTQPAVSTSPLPAPHPSPRLPPHTPPRPRLTPSPAHLPLAPLDAAHVLVPDATAEEASMAEQPTAIHRASPPTAPPEDPAVPVTPVREGGGGGGGGKPHATWASPSTSALVRGSNSGIVMMPPLLAAVVGTLAPVVTPSRAASRAPSPVQQPTTPSPARALPMD